MGGFKVPDRWDITDEYGGKIGEIREGVDWEGKAANGITAVIFWGLIICGGFILYALYQLIKFAFRYPSLGVPLVLLLGAVGIYYGSSVFKSSGSSASYSYSEPARVYNPQSSDPQASNPPARNPAPAAPGNTGAAAPLPTPRLTSGTVTFALTTIDGVVGNERVRAYKPLVDANGKKIQG